MNSEYDMKLRHERHIVGSKCLLSRSSCTEMEFQNKSLNSCIGLLNDKLEWLTKLDDTSKMSVPMSPVHDMKSRHNTHKMINGHALN